MSEVTFDFSMSLDGSVKRLFQDVEPDGDPVPIARRFTT